MIGVTGLGAWTRTRAGNSQSCSTLVRERGSRILVQPVKGCHPGTIEACDLAGGTCRDLGGPTNNQTRHVRSGSGSCLLNHYMMGLLKMFSDVMGNEGTTYYFMCLGFTIALATVSLLPLGSTRRLTSGFRFTLIVRMGLHLLSKSRRCTLSFTAESLLATKVEGQEVCSNSAMMASHTLTKVTWESCNFPCK